MVLSKPNSSKSGPPTLGSSVQTGPPDHSSVKLETCKVNDSLSPSGPPRIPDSPCETCSENNLASPNLKEVNVCSSSVTGSHPAQGMSVQTCPTDQLPANLDSGKENDPLIPSGHPQLLDPPQCGLL
ncbi:hypothetical protein Nepgr_022945 [Nepenthes gracilis]|uniref:Uncharacterized protein n=1 Tax=Nepenthes gracilis TaxID=150966 RepID=A0AAD3XXG4_NEPGR|nr:hypothetical protein Nepgr_022945 [Nepenthes gracilis]